jgi:hypothetical protein
MYNFILWKNSTVKPACCWSTSDSQTTRAQWQWLLYSVHDPMSSYQLIHQQLAAAALDCWVDFQYSCEKFILWETQVFEVCRCLHKETTDEDETSLVYPI